MKADPVFKRYDIRGRYPGELDQKFAERIGKAVGTFTARNYDPKIVVTRDTKKSSEQLKNAVISGITSTGCEVIDAGTGPTDLAAFTGSQNNAVSVQVTSSHLPLDFNGFKFMYPEGNGFKNPDLDRLKQLFRNQEFENGGAEVAVQDSVMEDYRRNLREFVKKFDPDFNRKIVVDTLGGAAHEVLPGILEDLGAEVIDLARNKKEIPYRDPPNPKPGMLEELEDRVEEEDADLGLATDMDGDRVTIYHPEKGFLTGDSLFGVLAQLLDSDVVASVDTSRAVEEIVESNVNEIHYTRVGDPFVMDRAIEKEVKLAGEPNGHYAFLDFVPYPSGTLSALIAAGVDLEEYLQEMPEYHVERESIEVEDKQSRMAEIREATSSGFEVLSEVDGVKFKTGEATVLARPSGSSPKIRVIAESRDSEEAKQAARETMDIIRNA